MCSLPGWLDYTLEKNGCQWMVGTLSIYYNIFNIRLSGIFI